VVDGVEAMAARSTAADPGGGATRECIAEIGPRRIERVLRNLVLNALEHGEGRDVRIRLAVDDERWRSACAITVWAALRGGGVGVQPVLAG